MDLVAQALMPVSYAWNASASSTGKSTCATSAMSARTRIEDWARYHDRSCFHSEWTWTWGPPKVRLFGRRTPVIRSVQCLLQYTWVPRSDRIGTQDDSLDMGSPEASIADYGSRTGANAQGDSEVGDFGGRDNR